MTIPDLDGLFGTLPATPAGRAAAVHAAFQGKGNGAARVASMQAKRYRCPWCTAAPGTPCTVAGGRNRMQGSHPSRVALVVPCEVHDVPAGVWCPREGPVCGDREALVAPVVSVRGLPARRVEGDAAPTE